MGQLYREGGVWKNVILGRVHSGFRKYVMDELRWMDGVQYVKDRKKWGGAEVVALFTCWGIY